MSKENNFIAYDPESAETEFFPTFKAAKNWLMDRSQDDDGGIADSWIAGDYRIFEIRAKSAFDKTHDRADFCQCDQDQECKCDLESWDYPEEWKFVGTAKVLDYENPIVEKSDLLDRLELLIDTAAENAQSFESQGMEVSKIATDAMIQAYKTVQKWIIDGE